MALVQSLESRSVCQRQCLLVFIFLGAGALICDFRDSNPMIPRKGFHVFKLISGGIFIHPESPF
jgi:hypothetical protein